MRKSNNTKYIGNGGGFNPLHYFAAKAVEALQWLVDLFYLPPFRRYISRERFRYFSCGVGNYIVLDSMLYYIIYHHIVDVRYINYGIGVISPHVASLIIVFPITFFSGFLLNRYIVFESTSRKIKFQLLRYAITVAGSILLNYIILKWLVEGCAIWPTPAKVICSMTTAIYSYIMARYFTFASGRKK